MVIVVELMVYFLSSPTVTVILAVPTFKAVTIPCSLTDTIPELSLMNVTFNPSGLVVYSIVAFSPTFKVIFSAVTLALFKLTVTVILALDEV